MGGATLRFEVLGKADAHFVQPILFRFGDLNHIRANAGVGAGKVKAEGADCKVTVAGHAIHVGIADRLIHDPRRLEIPIRIAGHARAMLGPFMLQQINRGRHAKIFAHNFAGKRRCRRTPLRIGGSIRFRPEAVQDEAKPSGIAITLAGRLIAFIAAMLRRPTQRQQIVCDRRRAHVARAARIFRTCIGQLFGDPARRRLRQNGLRCQQHQRAEGRFRVERNQGRYPPRGPTGLSARPKYNQRPFRQ